MKNKKEIITAAFIAIVLILIANEYVACDGKIVRGLFWFECLKGGE